MTGLELVNARVSSKRGVFAGAGSDSLDGVSGSLRRYVSLSAVLRALQTTGGSGVIVLTIVAFLFEFRSSPLSAFKQKVADRTQVERPGIGTGRPKPPAHSPP